MVRLCNWCRNAERNKMVEGIADHVEVLCVLLPHSKVHLTSQRFF
jgi:hypothetical protein